MPLHDIYEPEMTYKNNGMLSGQFTKKVAVGDDNLPWDNPLIAAFVNDIELQYLEFRSINIGFVKSLTKHLKRTGGES